jgi:hypothetical protein
MDRTFETVQKLLEEVTARTDLPAEIVEMFKNFSVLNQYEKEDKEIDADYLKKLESEYPNNFGCFRIVIKIRLKVKFNIFTVGKMSNFIFNLIC